MITSIPYCGVAPVPADLLHKWNFDPFLLAALGVLLLVGLISRRSIDWRAYGAGWLVLFVCFVSPLCALSSALFSARSAHHLLIVCLAAPLLAYAFPISFNRRIAGVSLSLAAVIKGSILAAWHIPGIYAASLSSGFVYWLLQGALLLSAILFWSCLRQARATQVFGALAGIMTLMGFIGAILTFAPLPLYGAHLTTTWVWGLSPLEDQQLAGLIMWAISLPVYVSVAAFVAGRLVSGVRHEALA